jgi:6,7-dimethyl-8-ribityllumazine synthase
MSNYKASVSDLSKVDKNSKILFITSEFNREFTKSLEDESQKYLNDM